MTKKNPVKTAKTHIKPTKNSKNPQKPFCKNLQKTLLK
jgi:hypothetical protein